MNSDSQSSFSSIVSKIAVVSIAVSLTAMAMAFFILGGFKEEIKNKIFNFKGHIEITRYNLGNAEENPPVSTNSDFNKLYKTLDYIDHVQNFAYKPGLLKTQEEVHGVMFKGMGSNFDTARFKQNMVEGRLFAFNDSTYSKEVVISKKISKALRLRIGDKVMIAFVQKNPRVRRLVITGIYETGLEEFDKQMILGDIALVRRINNWADTLVGGHEIFIKDPDRMAAAEEDLFNKVDVNLYVEKVSDKYVQLFDWLNLLNQNVAVLLALILFVSAVNMVSILLILIMERTHMIGVLQALGAAREQIKRIFVYHGMGLILKGLVIGNLAAVSLALVQDKFKLVSLDAENYYMYHVPIQWDVGILLLLNIGVFVMVSLALGIPTLALSRIKPIAAIKFD